MLNYKKYEKYKAISFDMYNTLIVRNVPEASDVFEMTDDYYVLKEKKKGIQNYKEKRINAEREAINRFGRNVGLNDIFECLAESEGDICEKYKAIEKSIEIDIASVNKEAEEIYKYFRSVGKKIFIITDMYLPRDTIEEILSGNGISGYEGLYISSEVNADKRSGKLFEKVLREEGLERNEIFHIGDNVISDFVMSKRAGIGSDLYIRKHAIQGKGLHRDILDIFIEENCVPNKSWDYEFGYKKLGPLFYGFGNWLSDEISKGNYDRVLFFSREGFVIKQICERISGNIENSSYFFASRRAMQVPIFWMHPSYDEVMSMMFIPYQLSLRWLLENWGLAAEQYIDLASSLGLAPDDTLYRNEISNDDRLRAFFDAIKKDLINNSKEEYECFREFFAPFKDSKRIAVVDIGWNGNMQRAFERLLHESGYEIEVHGYYLGCLKKSKNYLQHQMRCYLRTEDDLYSDYIIDYYALTLLELLLSAPHGTVQKYLRGGNVQIDTCNYRETETYCSVKEMQTGALSFVEDFKKVGKYFSENALFFSRDIFRTFSCPTYKEALNLGKLTTLDTDNVPMIINKKRINYLLHPREFKADIIRSSWKIGFLKRVFIIRAPYFDLMRFVRKMLEKEVVNG